jgi:hypothetical protein
MRDQITEKVIRLIETRSDKGFQTYGVTMDREDLTPEQWIDHAIEEALDLAIYLTKIKTIMYENNPQDRRIHPFVSGAQAGPLATK